MNAIIIDDERLARTELKNLLNDFPEIEVVDEAANADEGIEKINKHHPDLIFLDIQMPGKTGFEMLEELDKVPMVVFTTAYDEYALKAFEVNAFDYLLKPIEPQRLAETITHLKHELSKPTDDEDIQENKSKLTEYDQVFVKDGEKCWFIKLSDIRLFESVGNYAKIYFGNFKPLILKSLNSLEERLDEKVFFRANRKHIINLKYIENIDTYFNGGLLVELKNGGEKVEISRRQTIKFKEKLSL